MGKGPNGTVSEIVEVEAYLGHHDPASHAFKGMTPRNRAMFEVGGTCYVYLSYGVHYCMNVSTRKPGQGEAILLRAAIPLVGIERMQRNRGGDKPPEQLCNGPGKLAEALGVDLRYNGLRYDRPDFKIVDLGKSLQRRTIGSSPRIGISQAKDALLRFFVMDSPWVSGRRV